MAPRVKIPFVVTENLAEALHAKLGFLDERIVRIRVDRDAGCVEFEATGPDAQRSVTEKIETLLRELSSLARESPAALFSHASSRPFPASDCLRELERSGDVVDLGAGTFALRGQFLRLVRALDARVLEFAAAQGAHDVALPVTTSIARLNQAHYFDRTPQFAQFLTSVRADAGAVNAAAAFAKSPGASTLPGASFREPTHVCRSAICLNCYPLWEGTCLPAGGSHAYTVSGPAFRNEGSSVLGLERLSEFHMRELVFCGDEPFVERKLVECRDWLRGFLERFDLTGELRAANDPFFAQESAPLREFQLAAQTKLELGLLNPASGNKVAVASVNNHGYHFAKAFRITLENGSFATTGCVGVGLERFVFLVLSQHGTDSARWPEPLREFFR